MKTKGLTIAAIALWSQQAYAQQFTVVDVTYTHGPTNTTDSHYRVRPQGPTNWRAPIDYASGTIHMHVEVFTKPSTEGTLWNFCFEGTASYSCAGTPSYRTPGVYISSQPFSRFYQYTMLDWSKPIRNVALILKDTMNVKPAPENVGAARSMLFMPTTVRIVLTIVPPGGTYVPPGDAGVPADGPPPRDATVAADRAPAADGRAPDTTTTADRPPASGDTAPASGDGPSSAGLDAGSSTSRNKGSSGCSIAPAGGIGPLWLLTVALYRRRRRDA